MRIIGSFIGSFLIISYSRLKEKSSENDETEFQAQGKHPEDITN